MEHPRERAFALAVASPENPLQVQGGRLDDVELELHCWGNPDPTRSNAILVCHSFSTDAFAAGSDPDASPVHRPWRQGARGWWDPLIGPGKPLDTDRYWVVCSNVLGGSGGSTGPATIAPDGKPWGERFPFVSIQDMVRAQERLARILGVERWRLVTGGSLGGLQTLAWGHLFPEKVERAVAVAVSARPSLSGIGHFAAGCAYIRREVESGGDGHLGLLAGFGTGRRYSGPAESRESDRQWAEQWPMERYHPWTYVRLAEAVMTFDLAADAGGGDPLAGARAIGCPVDLVSFRDDQLFPPDGADRLADAIRKAGGSARHLNLAGSAGHDSFLDDPLVVADALREALER